MTLICPLFRFEAEAQLMMPLTAVEINSIFAYRFLCKIN